MKKRKISYLLVSTMVLLTLCFGLAGCSNPVKEELLTYINVEFPKLAEMENTAVTTFESVTGNNYTDDQTLYDALVEVIIPNYTKLNTNLEDLSGRLKTTEVRKLNEKYIDGTNAQMSAFNMFKVAIEENDSSKVLLANERLDKGRKSIREFLAELKDICKKNGVTLNNTNE